MWNRIQALCLAAAVAMLSPVAAEEDREDHEAARQAVEAGEILPLPRILERVRQQYPGQVLEIELERRRPGWIYEIRVLQPGGRLVRLEVDAHDGRVVQRRNRGQRGRGE